MEGLDWLEVQLLETLQLRMLSETLALPAKKKKKKKKKKKGRWWGVEKG